MDIKKTIFDNLNCSDSYAGLGVLEAVCVWGEECPDRAVPEQMHNDMVSMFGKEAVIAELESLLQMSDRVNRVASSMRLTLNGVCLSASGFLRGLGEYLVSEAGAIITDQSCTSRLRMKWEDEVYELRIAFSPVWLPAMADKAAEKNMFVAAICPAAALPWEKTMIHYYGYPSFRNHTACYDPWNSCKMNISKGGLFTYFDWFFRDMHRGKFLIPNAFTQALLDMGLLRYNDEK